MKPDYKYSESRVKPTEIEVGKHSVALRRNITEEERTNTDGDKLTFWTYEEARMSYEEFAEYSNFMLVTGQKNGDDNQLIIMDAIADLYDIVLGLTQEGTK